MKMNPFNTGSDLFPFRWFIIITIAVMGLLAYANLSGWRLLYFSNQQQWGRSGPGYHK